MKTHTIYKEKLCLLQYDKVKIVAKGEFDFEIMPLINCIVEIKIKQIDDIPK